MNIVMISEGRTELGKGYPARPPLQILSDEKLGALEVLVTRIGQETYGAQVRIMSPAQAAHRYGKRILRPSLTEVLADPDLLKEALGPCFLRSTEHETANGAVVACDYEYYDAVDKAVNRFRQSFQNAKIVFLTFRPEFEVMLFQKRAMEDAANLKHCSIKLPDCKAYQRGGLKEAWAQCIRDAGYRNSVDSAFKADVAKRITLNTPCDNQDGIEYFNHGLGLLFSK